MRMSARVDWPVNGATVRIMPGPKATSEALGILDGAEPAHRRRRSHGRAPEGVEIPGGEAISDAAAARRPTPNGEPFVLLVDRYRTGARAPGVHPRRPADHRPAPAGHARDA